MSSLHCESVPSRTMGTVDLLSRLSVLQFAARCCTCHAVGFQPVSKSAATPVLKPSCIERSLKRTGEWTSCQVHHTHISKHLLGLSGNAFDVTKRSDNFSMSMALLSLKHIGPTVPELAGWISTLVKLETLCITYLQHSRS